MYIVKQEWKGSPDGCSVIEFKPGPCPVQIPVSLVNVALQEGWIEPAPVEPASVVKPAQSQVVDVKPKRARAKKPA